MENKEGAGGVQKAAPEKEAARALMEEEMVKCGRPGCCGCRSWREGQEQEAAKSVEGTKGPLGRLKDAPAVLKSKARAAGEYAALRTRQGISLFGEPKIGAIKAIVDRC